MTEELSTCRRLVLPPAAVALLPNEDSWSELAKQFLRRESFLGHRAKHGRRRKRGGTLQHEDSGDGEGREAQRRRSAETGAGDPWDGNDLQGASPMSSQEVWLRHSAGRSHETRPLTALCLRHNACVFPCAHVRRGLGWNNRIGHTWAGMRRQSQATPGKQGEARGAAAGTFAC